MTLISISIWRVITRWLGFLVAVKEMRVLIFGGISQVAGRSAIIRMRHGGVDALRPPLLRADDHASAEKIA
jgi:hypothetical protein